MEQPHLVGYRAVSIASKQGVYGQMSEPDLESLIETIIVLSDPETVEAINSDEGPRDGQRWSDLKKGMSQPLDNVDNPN